MEGRYTVKPVREWYDKTYEGDGFLVQKKYPNEELIRFLFREFQFRKEPKPEKGVRVLELGCGPGANLWAIAKEGFDAYGIDLSPRAIELCRRMLSHWGVRAEVTVADMREIPFGDKTFDAVVDIFSGFCLGEEAFVACLREVQRVLKRKGKFFSYAPSTNSDTFRDYLPSQKIEPYTLAGIQRKSSPYYGNDYLFRFIPPLRYRDVLTENGWKVTYLEIVSRTFNSTKEYAEFVTIVGEKK
jgi:ubiquinone/menaquinone biosynthesis C-methylase UbiE